MLRWCLATGSLTCHELADGGVCRVLVMPGWDTGNTLWSGCGGVWSTGSVNQLRPHWDTLHCDDHEEADDESVECVAVWDQWLEWGASVEVYPAVLAVVTQSSAISSESRLSCLISDCLWSALRIIFLIKSLVCGLLCTISSWSQYLVNLLNCS